jgi:ankyrin repeat protein
VKLTLELGNDWNAVNDAGDAALHGAANAGYPSIIQFLAERGANLNVRNKKGQTPLDLAKGPGELMLRKLGAQGHSPQAAPVL